jgi:signal transduction histidine kinase
MQPQPAHHQPPTSGTVHFSSQPLPAASSGAAAAAAHALFSSGNPYYLALYSAAARAHTSTAPPMSLADRGGVQSSASPSPSQYQPSQASLRYPVPTSATVYRYNAAEVHRKEPTAATETNSGHVLQHSFSAAAAADRTEEEERVRIARLLPREPLPLSVAFQEDPSDLSSSPENLSLRRNDPSQD